MKVTKEGPSKTAQVPLIVGPRNAGKSTALEPVLSLFGKSRVMIKPKLGATCPLAKLVGSECRFFLRRLPAGGVRVEAGEQSHGASHGLPCHVLWPAFPDSGEPVLQQRAA